MNFFFWTLLNLAVPIAGPIFTLAFVAPAHGWHFAKVLIGASVRDGQLFWCPIGLCAAGIYEAVTGLQRGSSEVELLEISIVGFSMLAFVCSNVVMTALVRGYESCGNPTLSAEKALRADRRDGAFPPSLIRLSVGATTLIAIASGGLSTLTFSDLLDSPESILELPRRLYERPLHFTQVRQQVHDRILAWSGIAMIADGIFMLGTLLVYSDFMKHC
ncbi:MAG: hypothetical protein CPDRYMAC_6174 [uncultured Paraburkholderia sp.]|nr:MAG: hypothetical protein CPDRYDRY_6118 [uncultured Paraburkholderia sp.]CAH2943816.1 MAG: hypothetical protein CPDRYMAC_6174 [uncultured Paraburkholderia sp.]